MSQQRYQCPRCSQSRINEEKTARFCGQFRAILDEEERKKAQFIERQSIFYLTRECKFVYLRWAKNCAGFRKKEV